MVKINSTEFGSITIDGETYRNDVVISWDGTVKEIRTSLRHVFGEPELKDILIKMPELIVIGTGDSGLLRVSEEVKRKCKQNAIELVYDISKKAIVKFNENVAKGKRVIAFIHVTC